MKSIIITCTFIINAVFVLSQDLYVVSKSIVKFTSDAPLELISAKSNGLQGAINTVDRSFVFRAPMKTFEGFNSALQQTHFNENYLETAKFPYTVFEGKIIEDIDLLTPGTTNVRGKGSFTCHGIKQERIIKCKIKVSADKIEISSEFTVLLADHNIKIPSVVSQKIAEEITVQLEVELIPKK